MGYCIAFIKFKIKISFQTCDFGLFHTLHFLAEKKNKIVQLHKYKILPPWKWLKHSIKTLAPQCAMPPAGKQRKGRKKKREEKKRKYTKQRVTPTTEGDSLTQSLTQHTWGWGKRWRERQHSLQSTVHNHLFSWTSLKLDSPATPPNKIP